LGRLVYWRDAWDDRAEDEERGRFNPLKNSDPEELPHRFGKAMVSLNGVAALPGHFQRTISEIITSTSSRHRQLIPSAMMIRPTGIKTPIKKPRKRKMAGAQDVVTISTAAQSIPVAKAFRVAIRDHLGVGSRAVNLSFRGGNLTLTVVVSFLFGIAPFS
jgi:hypothetical protein